jgi:hypothetical protein
MRERFISTLSNGVDSPHSEVAGAKRQSGRDVKLPNPLHLVPRIRMSGGIPNLPIYVSMARAGTTEPLPSSLPVIIHAV